MLILTEDVFRKLKPVNGFGLRFPKPDGICYTILVELLVVRHVIELLLICFVIAGSAVVGVPHRQLTPRPVTVVGVPHRQYNEAYK